MPVAAIGNASSTATAGLKKTGFSEFPKDTAGFLELCKALQEGHPAGFTHGHGVGDGNNYAHWLLWSHGGKMVDERRQGHHQQPRDAEVDRIRDGALQDLHSGHGKLARRQQQPRLPRRRTRSSPMASRSTGRQEAIRKLAEIAKDIRTTNLPIGPVGQSVELHQTTSAHSLQLHSIPGRGEGLPQFMFEEAQMNDWITGLAGLLLPDAEGFR